MSETKESRYLFPPDNYVKDTDVDLGQHVREEKLYRYINSTREYWNMFQFNVF